MWLEFVGLPGAGKSRFFEKHATRLAARFRIVDSRGPTRFTGLVARLHYLRLRFRLGDRELARKLAYRLSFRPLGGGDVFFEDSGILQAVLENLVAAGFDALEEKIAVLGRLRLPDLVIYFRDEADKIADRELARRPRRFEIPDGLLRERYRRAAQILESRILPLVREVRLADSDQTSRWLENGLGDGAPSDG